MPPMMTFHDKSEHFFLFISLNKISVTTFCLNKGLKEGTQREWENDSLDDAWERHICEQREWASRKEIEMVKNVKMRTNRRIKLEKFIKSGLRNRLKTSQEDSRVSRVNF